MNGCLYQSRVAHARLFPAKHAFEYTVFYCWIDLDEFPETDRASCLFSVNRPGIYSFHESDHLQSSPGNLKNAVVGWLANRDVRLPETVRIRLLTLPRFMGYVFNPVSFFFCYNEDNSLICAIAEVGNTFGETKLYLLPLKGDGDEKRAGARLPKHFYVSPFSNLDVDFDFDLMAPERSVSVRVDDYAGDRKVLVTSLEGERAELSTASLLQQTAMCPAVTAKVIFLIHWQALRLWLKGFRWFAKKDRPDQQTDVLKSHDSNVRSQT
jgi:uncharacterized protein